MKFCNRLQVATTYGMGVPLAETHLPNVLGDLIIGATETQ